MASIDASINLYDNFSNVANQVNVSINGLNSSVENMQSTMERDLNVSGMNSYSSKVDECADNFGRVGQEASQAGDNIKKDQQGQEKFNNEIKEGTNNANGLAAALGSAVSIYALVAAGRKVVSFINDCTDAYDTQLNAQNQLLVSLSNMLDEDYVAEFEVEADVTPAEAAIESLNDTDVTVTVTAEGRALEAEYDQIMDKAAEIQSEGIFGDEAMIAGAAEFATYMSDADAITMMMDTLSDYAMGMAGGAEVEANEMVDYATNLGKIMTGSYDAMTKKGFEFTDAQKEIIEGTASEAEIAATLGEEYVAMSDDMQAAAAITQVIEDNWAGLYQTMSNTPQGQITQLSNSFSDMKEIVAEQLYPYIGKLVQVINNSMPTIQTIMDSIVGKLQTLIGFVSKLAEGVAQVATFFSNNWGIIGPIISAVAGAMVGLLAVYGAYKIAVAATAAVEAISNIMKNASAAAAYRAAGATEAETIKQYGLNAAMLSCPITWIIAGIVALIAVVIAVANHIANLSETTSSAFGVICGWVSVAGAWFKNLGLTVANIALGIWNSMQAVANNIKVAFSNAIAGVQQMFYSLLSTACNVIAGICEALNKLPFVEFDYSGITSAADSYATKAADAAASKGDYQSVSDAFSEGYSTYDTWSEGWKDEAYAAGAAWGDSKWSSLSLSSSGNDYDALASSVDALASDYGNIDDTATGSNVGSIADSAGSIADSVSTSDEQLKYLRDIAEQETINRYTLAEVNIEQTNNNNIASTLDLDGVVDGLTDAVNEAVDIVTEGVHV